MKSMMLILCIVSVIVASEKTSTQPKDNTIYDNSAYWLNQTEYFDLTGKENKRAYRIYVQLPWNYKSNNSSKHPVIYLTDAQWHFPMMYSMRNCMYTDSDIPDAIVVGLSWAGEDPNYHSLRTYDFTPTQTKQEPNSGGAAAYLAFIKNELIPEVEKRYRTTGTKMLLGTSYGGIFTLYSLFHEPNLFDGYISLSPALNWDNHVANKWPDLLKSKKCNARLYVSWGVYETFAPFEEYTKGIIAKNIEGLQVKYDEVQGSGHASSIFEGYVKGLQHIFKKPAITLDEKSLKPFAGSYTCTTKDFPDITIRFKQGKLVMRDLWGVNQTLLAADNKSFYVGKGLPLELWFTDETNSKGMVTFKWYDNVREYKRVK